ncbi:MAG: aspartate--tRNA ligase, partial [Halanaerobiales bacterium]
MKLKRTHKCTNLCSKNVGEEVVISGWVQRRRDHGGLIFVDLRDRSGVVQTVFDPKNKEVFKVAENLRSEYVVSVKGKARKRPEGNINKDMETGEIEIEINDIEVLDEADTPPFQLENDLEASEDLRLKYRYLDLRRPFMKEIIELRHKVMKRTRDYLVENDFWEIETPILTKSTPEGARDYLVPSRVKPGNFYALPQSPQLFKQLLMVSGMERYFQIARCFRDEDLRANRQPEFTQIDLEMSFVERDDIFEIVEGLIRHVFEVTDIEVPANIELMSYNHAMKYYGSDKPDLRFDMKLKDISQLVKESDFNIFSSTVNKGGQVKGITVKNGASLSRSKIDFYINYVKKFGAKGLAWIAVNENGLKSPISKFLSEEELNNILKKMNAKTGDLMLFVADKAKVVANALGKLRLLIADELNLIPEDKYEFTWIVDFPLFEYDEEEEKYLSQHHPFTAPLKEDIELLDSSPKKVRSDAYDLVLNGEELGGGSIRIHDSQLQQKIF